MEGEFTFIILTLKGLCVRNRVLNRATSIVIYKRIMNIVK